MSTGFEYDIDNGQTIRLACGSNMIHDLLAYSKDVFSRFMDMKSS
jgi:hypothetical protein